MIYSIGSLENENRVFEIYLSLIQIKKKKKKRTQSKLDKT